MPSIQLSETTPILDSGLLPKPGRKRLGEKLLGFALGGLFAMALPLAIHAQPTSDDAIPYIFFGYLACFVLAVTVHELGHLLAGWMVGFRFSSVSIGPISLAFEYGRLKVRIRRALPAGGYAGMHIDRIRRLRRRLLRFIAGGPMANLATAAIGSMWLSYAPPRSIGWAAFLEMFWIMSALLGLINLVPFRIGMLYSDGARMRMLRSSLPKSRRWITLTAIGNQSQIGVRPKTWRQTWLHAASHVGDRSVDDFAGNWAAYIAFNDRKDAPSAASHLEKCLSLVKLLGPSMKDLVALEAAVFTAWFREDTTTAEKWVAQVRRLKALPALTQARAEIALRCAHKDFASALARWQRAYSFIEKLPATPIRKRLTEGFLEWRSEIEERENAHRIRVASMVPVQELQGAE